LLDSPERSDLSVVVGSHKFHAHHIILNLRTDFFATATKPEHGFTESIDSTVVIEEHSVHAVWRMLTYCYTGEYENTKMKKDSPEEDDSGALKHVRVYALADMLNIPELKTIAMQKLETFFKSNWDAKSFPGTVREAYLATAPRDTRLRRVLVDVARKHLLDLADSEDFRNTLYDFGEFSGEIVLANVANPIPVHPRSGFGVGAAPRGF